MNIYKHEFRMHLQSVIIWSVSLVLMMFVFMSVFTSFAVDAELLNEMMSRFPKELLIAFGMNGLDLATVLGFFSFVFLFCQICLAIQAANYGFSILSMEERELTADFLLAKPVSRTTVLTSKLLAALTGLTITNAVVWTSSFTFITMFREGRSYDSGRLLLLLSSIVLFQLFFLTVGMLISLLVKRVRNVTPYSMGLAFGMYVLSSFGDMLGDDTLEIITPFRQFEPNYIIRNGEFELPLVLLSVAVTVISMAGSYFLYLRKDMQSAV
jgi:ABC-2 type transport system permease protein